MSGYEVVRKALGDGIPVEVDGISLHKDAGFALEDYARAKIVVVGKRIVKRRYGLVQQDSPAFLYDIPVLTRAKQLLIRKASAISDSPQDSYDIGYAIAVLEHVMCGEECDAAV